MFKPIATLILGLALPAMAQDARTVIANAQKALGNITSITYSGDAKDVNFQQCGAHALDMQCRGTHDPMRPINNYVRIIDLSGPLSRATGATNNQGGGGSTVVTPGTFSQQITPQQADTSQPWNASLELYITPWGFLKGAADHNTTVSKKGGFTVLTWSPKVKAPSGKDYTISAYINNKNLIERVETVLQENIMGDMQIVATYSGWKDFGGVMAPTRIVQTRGGFPFFEVNVTAARANPSDAASIALPPAPPAGKGGPAPAAAKGGPAPLPSFNVEAEKLGDGLYRLTTGAGSYDSVVVEFKDHVMMLEAGQSIARAEAYIAKIKELFPGKPIRYVMNTHPHADHTGGLPALVAEGATIITHQNNVDFLSKSLNNPRTLLTDVLAKNPKKAKVEGVGAKKVYSDGTRTVEFHHVPGAPHSNGLIIAYIPKERVLFQGDFSVNPGQPANDHVKALAPVLSRLNLDYDRYINVHASAQPQTKKDVEAALAMR